MRKIIISLTFVALVGLVGYLTLTSNQSVAIKVHNTNEDLSQFINEFKNIDEIGSCMSKVDEKVDEFLQNSDKATRKQFHKEHNKFFRWLHKYVDDHKGEAPSVEEVQAQVEKIGGLKGPVAPIWQAEIDQYTECSAAAFDLEYVIEFKEFKDINEIANCFDKGLEKEREFIHGADDETKKEFQKDQDQFLVWMVKYLNDHQGQAPSVDEFKAEIEQIGGLKGPAAQIWQNYIDLYTECLAAPFDDEYLKEFVFDFKTSDQIEGCMQQLSFKVITDSLSQQDQQLFGNQFGQFRTAFINYLSSHNNHIPTVDEFKAIIAQIGGDKGPTAGAWKQVVEQYSQCANTL